MYKQASNNELKNPIFIRPNMNISEQFAPLDPSTSFDKIPTDGEIRASAQAIQQADREQNIKTIIKKQRETDKNRNNFWKSQLFYAISLTSATALLLCATRPTWIRVKTGPYCIGKTSIRRVVIICVVVFILTMYGPELYIRTVGKQ